jgi:hypothetical protein
MRLVPVIDLMSPIRLWAALVREADLVRSRELMLDSDTSWPLAARDVDIDLTSWADGGQFSPGKINDPLYDH